MMKKRDEYTIAYCYVIFSHPTQDQVYTNLWINVI